MRALISLTLLSLLAAPSLPAQDKAEAPRFLPVPGENLNERRFQLPGDFEADLNLVFMAFQRYHQKHVDTWLPFATELERRYANLRFYELPTMSEFPEAFRSFVDNGMRRGIPSLDTRSRTICLYLDKAPLLEALKIPNERKIQAMLVRRDGQVLWMAPGGFDDKNAKALGALLEKHARKRPPAELDLALTARKNGSFDTLLEAARAAGVFDELRVAGPLTLFAPNDAAFARLGEEETTRLLQPKNKEELKRLVLHHVARGYLDRAQLATRKRVFTLAGTWLEITGTKDAPRYGGAEPAAELPCTNGVLHTMTTVLVANSPSQG